MKLWQGRFEEESDPVFEKMNRSLGIDAVLLEVDIRASRAHARSLLGCSVLTQEEWKAIDQGLEQILSEYTPEEVKASPYEDVHTFVEATLASKIGSVAGKLHTGRSRNDQVATDFRLFVRKAVGLIVADLEALQIALSESGARYSDVIIPAYTHLRRGAVRAVAGPSGYSSAGLRRRGRFQLSSGSRSGGKGIGLHQGFSE